MPCELPLNKVPEILELLWFKNNSLIKTELFLETMRGQAYVELLEIDIGLTIQEINDLQDILVHSAN